MFAFSLNLSSILIANIVTTSKALVTTSVALVITVRFYDHGIHCQGPFGSEWLVFKTLPCQPVAETLHSAGRWALVLMMHGIT